MYVTLAPVATTLDTTVHTVVVSVIEKSRATNAAGDETCGVLLSMWSRAMLTPSYLWRDSEELIRNATGMALGENTQGRIAAAYPNSHHLFPQLEEACTVLKEHKNGRGHVEFFGQGIDACGRLIVKWFDASIRFFCATHEESGKQ